MNRQDAEKSVAGYVKPIFGFALKRCKNRQDAEDLSQEITLKAFRALLAKEDIVDMDKFIWTIAHNMLSNYYRDISRSAIGISMDEIAESLEDHAAYEESAEREASILRLQQEIAYLSKLQRKIIIAYYFEHRKQGDIACELGIPLGTVKWHLFEAKKELKRGMETVRHDSELKFNPVKFEICGMNGSPGTRGANSNFFRSALSQNIVYTVWKSGKTVNEMADSLGVSPVYVESEAEYLAEYGFLTKVKDKYICNMLINDPTNKLVSLHDEMYSKAAQIFANRLYDELAESGILRDERIICRQTDGAVLLTKSNRADENYILWALIPYLAAVSGEGLMNTEISFEEAATYRPDGGHNICYASIIRPEVKKPMYFDSMKQWNGPCWNGMKIYYGRWILNGRKSV